MVSHFSVMWTQSQNGLWLPGIPEVAWPLTKGSAVVSTDEFLSQREEALRGRHGVAVSAESTVDHIIRAVGDISPVMWVVGDRSLVQRMVHSALCRRIVVVRDIEAVSVEDYESAPIIPSYFSTFARADTPSSWIITLQNRKNQGERV